MARRRPDDGSDRDVPRLQVEVPGPVRIRSAFILALGVLAVAAAAGVSNVQVARFGLALPTTVM